MYEILFSLFCEKLTDHLTALKEKHFSISASMKNSRGRHFGSDEVTQFFLCCYQKHFFIAHQKGQSDDVIWNGNTTIQFKVPTQNSSKLILSWVHFPHNADLQNFLTLGCFCLFFLGLLSCCITKENTSVLFALFVYSDHSAPLTEFQVRFLKPRTQLSLPETITQASLGLVGRWDYRYVSKT